MTEAFAHRNTPTKPSAARVYNYLIGGDHHFMIDRRLATKLLEQVPTLGIAARQNYAFVQRLTRWALANGVDQVLDLGAGIPAKDPVHEIVAAASPDGRVVYVDYEETAYDVGRDILRGNPNAVFLHGDLRFADMILDNSRTQELLDFARPIAVIFSSVLHLIPNSEDPARIVGRYGSRLARGSLIAITHSTPDLVKTEDEMAALLRVIDIYNEGGAYERITTRSIPDLLAMVEGAELIEPGVVPAALWHPDTELTDDEAVVARIQAALVARV